MRVRKSIEDNKRAGMIDEAATAKPNPVIGSREILAGETK